MVAQESRIQSALVVLLVSLVCVAAKPYWHEVVPQELPANVQQIGQLGQQVPIKPNQPAEVEQANSDPLHGRIHGHMNQLLSHGGSAVMSAVEQVQPDLRNIGKDLTDATQVIRDNVGKRIEPLAQTVRPYIDHAQKVVAPLVKQAREEVPKMINQAGPTISNLGEQVRTGLSGVWDRISSVASQATQAISQSGQSAQNQAQQAGANLQNSVNNAVQ